MFGFRWFFWVFFGGRSCFDFIGFLVFFFFKLIGKSGLMPWFE